VNIISLMCHIYCFYIVLNNQDTERFFLFSKGVLGNSRVPRCADAGTVMKLPTITNFFRSCSQITFPFTRMQPCSSSRVYVCVLHQPVRDKMTKVCKLVVLGKVEAGGLLTAHLDYTDRKTINQKSMGMLQHYVCGHFSVCYRSFFSFIFPTLLSRTLCVLSLYCEPKCTFPIL